MKQNRTRTNEREKKQFTQIKISFVLSWINSSNTALVNLNAAFSTSPTTQSKINGTERTKKECQGEKKRRIRLQTKSDVISIKWLNIYSFRTKKSQVQQFCLPFAQNENAINLTRWSGAKRTQSSLNWRFDSKADMTRYESNTRASISESHPQTEAGKKRVRS